jgi:hypothetical protein
VPRINFYSNNEIRERGGDLYGTVVALLNFNEKIYFTSCFVRSSRSEISLVPSCFSYRILFLLPAIFELFSVPAGKRAHRRWFPFVGFHLDLSSVSPLKQGSYQ